MNIYLDTNLWNGLLDSGVNPAHFVQRLAAADKRLVLGLHVFYELARTPESSRPEAPARAMALFECLGRYLDAKILCAKDQSELLPAEMLMLKKLWMKDRP